MRCANANRLPKTTLNFFSEFKRTMGDCPRIRIEWLLRIMIWRVPLPHKNLNSAGSILRSILRRVFDCGTQSPRCRFTNTNAPKAIASKQFKRSATNRLDAAVFVPGRPRAQFPNRPCCTTAAFTYSTESPKMTHYAPAHLRLSHLRKINFSETILAFTAPPKQGCCPSSDFDPTRSRTRFTDLTTIHYPVS